MGRQLLKGFTMLVLIVGVAFMSAAATANGQTGHGIKANVPFEFEVGDKTLPAGEYTVKTMTGRNGVLVIRGQDDAAMRLSIAIGVNKAQKRAKLVFHRYGQRYFLSEVWSDGEEGGRRLLKSRAQRSIESELAATPSKSEQASSAYEVVEIVAMIR